MCRTSSWLGSRWGSVVLLEVGDEVGLIVDVVGGVEVSFVVVECGLVGIVVVVKV